MTLDFMTLDSMTLDSMTLDSMTLDSTVKRPAVRTVSLLTFPVVVQSDAGTLYNEAMHLIELIFQF